MTLYEKYIFDDDDKMRIVSEYYQSHESAQQVVKRYNCLVTASNRTTRGDDNDFAEDAIEPLIVEKAQSYRKDNPGLGCSKLYLIVKKLFEENKCMPGRDAFIEILRKHGLMVHLRRRKHYRTTDSNHHYRKYPNLIKDAYSHKIVGWAVGSTLETIYPLQALQMALATIADEMASRLIHHSDRGCQYCSDAYVAELKKHDISISMTQSRNPL